MGESVKNDFQEWEANEGSTPQATAAENYWRQTNILPLHLV